MTIGGESPLSIALFVLYCVALVASIQYLRRGSRRQRLWRLLNRSWAARPAKRFHPLGRSDYIRTAAKAAAIGVALTTVMIAVAAIDSALRPRGLPDLVMALAFIPAIGTFVAFAGAIGQLWRAATFRGPSDLLPFMVLSNGVRVGTASFVAYDAEQEVIAGPFRPEPAFAAIHPTVRLLAQAYPDIGGPDARRAKLDEYMAQRGALKLELLDADGVLVPTTEINILDFTMEGGEDVFRIDVEAELDEWERRGLVATEEGERDG